MTIKLTESKQIVVREIEVISSDEIFINEIVDNGTSVIALITPISSESPIFNQVTIRKILWEGESYEAIGQWTDTDVEKRLKQIL